jgi:hypothetical protein
MERQWLVTYKCDAHAGGVDLDAWKASIDRVTPVLPDSTILIREGTKITISLLLMAVDATAALKLADKGVKRSMRRMGFARSLDEIFVKVTVGRGELVFANRKDSDV